MKFNEKIIMLRKNKNLSQDELGNELGVARQTISKWELGETTPEMDKLIKISKFFEIGLDELIKDSESNIEIEKNTNNTNTQKLAGLTIKILKGIGIFIVIALATFIIITALSMISFNNIKTTTIVESEETEINSNTNE